MDIIKELTRKYGGNYSEDQVKGGNTPIGKYVYQPKSGLIEIDGSKISISLNEVSGAMPTTEPFRITLHLKQSYEMELVIFPKGLWKKVLDLILSKPMPLMPKSLSHQFSFSGNKDLIKRLASDQVFVNKIVDERVYIKTKGKPVTRIVLTPEYGIKDLEQFEKYVTILKQIESKIDFKYLIKKVVE